MNTSNNSRIDAALLVLRLAAGGIMIVHGAQKLFVFGFAGVTGAFTQMGLPMPGVLGPCIALLEFFGPIALILGVLTRPVAFLLMCDMLGAIFTVHLKNGFFNPQGFEFPLSLAMMYLTLVIAGAGAMSVDAALARRRAGTA